LSRNLVTNVLTVDQEATFISDSSISFSLRMVEHRWHEFISSMYFLMYFLLLL
jgi:hypothetical protein